MISMVGIAKSFSKSAVIAASLLVLLLAACNRDPNVAKQKYLAKGNDYYNKTRYSEAIIEYRNAIKIDSRFGEAHYRLGMALAASGQLGDAAREYSAAIGFSPDNLDARLRLGEAMLSGRQFLEARMQGDEVLNRDPKNASAHLLYGHIHMQQREYDQAITEYQQAVSLSPNDAVPYGNLGLAYLLAGDPGPSEAAFQKALELAPEQSENYVNLANFYRTRQANDKAEAVLRRGIAQKPKIEAIRFAYADFLYTIERQSDAEAALKEIENNTTDFPNGHRDVADFYSAHGQYEAALQRYLALPNSKQKEPQVMHSIAECYVNLKRWNDAQIWVDKGIKDKDLETVFRLLRARIYIGQNHYRDAISELQRDLQANPNLMEAYYYLGQAYFRKGDMGAAKVAFGSALRVAPGYIPALLALGDLALQERAGDVALQYASQIVSNASWVPEAFIVLGNAQLLKGDLPTAQRAFQQAVDLNPRGPDGYERLGRILAKQGKSAEAQKLFEESLKRDETFVPALSALVDENLGQNRPQQARALIERQIQISPQDAGLQLLQGRFCVGQKDYACAEQSFKRAIELEPNSVDGYVALGQLYGVTNRQDEMLQNFARAQQASPEYLPVYIMMGSAYEKRGDYDKAKQAYQEALTVDANYVPAQNNLAWLYVARGGSVDQALELAQRAQAQRPDDPNINDTLGWVYYKKGLYPNAIPLLEACVRKDPKNSRYQMHLGMTYLAGGKEQLGRRSLESALRIGLDREDEQTVRKALEPNRS